LDLKAKEALPLLLRSLPNAPLQGQSLGFSLLQSYPREETSSALRVLVASRSPYLSLASAAWLWRTEDKSFAPKIADALGRAGSPEEIAQMVPQISGILDERVTAAVRGLLAARATVPVLDAVLYHLLVAGDPQARGAASALLKSPELTPDARALVGAFLIAAGDAGAAQAFAAAVAAASQQALVRLPRLLERAPRLDEAVTAALVALLESDAASGQRAAVARIFAKHPSSKAVPALRRLMEEGDDATARAAFDALNAAGALEPASLRRLFSKRAQLALLAADALRRLDDPSGLPRVLELVQQPGTHRAEALRMLGNFRVAEAVPVLLAALEDGDEAARSAAFYGLEVTLRSLFPYRTLDLRATGYTPQAPENQRRAAAAKIAAWWQAARGRLK
jgi:HEAT repeat protein